MASDAKVEQIVEEAIQNDDTMDILNKPQPYSLDGDASKNWKTFKRDYNIFMRATGRHQKTKATQSAILQNLLGPEAQELLETFELGDEDLEDPDKILQAFEDHAKPQINETFERFVFTTRARHDGETIDQYVAQMKKLAKNCNYGTLHDSLIRDNIIRHMKDTRLQQTVLKIKDLTLKDLIENIKTSEISANQMETIRKSTEKSSVAVVKESHGRKHYSSKHKTVRTNNQHQEERRPSGHERQEEDSHQGTSNEYMFTCRKCDQRHAPRKCPAFGKQCLKCHKPNHYTSCCRAKLSANTNKVNTVNDYLEADSTDNEDSDSDFRVHSLKIASITNDKSNKEEDWYEKMRLNNKKVELKIDTGANCNVIPLRICEKIDKSKELKKSLTVLEAYGGTQIRALGKIETEIQYQGKKYIASFVVVRENLAPLLGLKTCKEIGIIKQVHSTEDTQNGKNKNDDEKNEFVQKNIDIFTGVGEFPKKYSIVTDPNVKPIANPPRRVPKTVKHRLKEALARLEKDGIISKNENPTSWVNSIVIREKEGGSLRICLDPTNLNKAVKRAYYEIPHIKTIAEKLINKKFYTLLDLKDGFWQIKLDEHSANLCTFSTPHGCFKFERLPFGINCAPEVFQKWNEENFGDIDGVVIYFDDLLITGNTAEEHDKNLSKVVERARQLNIKFNQSKIQYKQNSVKYVGYVFSENGKAIAKSRIKAITELKEPTDLKELQRILGMINYLREFVPNLATETTQLRELLKKKSMWMWLPQHSKILKDIEDKITKAPILQTFDETKDTYIQTDASSTGVGCCLLQDNKPVAFASRSLTETEQNYAQIEKELLSVVFATKKFHYFIYGRPVTVLSDHKPLVALNTKELKQIDSSRLQKLALKLMKYELKIQYLPGKYMYIADLLSRNYLQCKKNDEIDLTKTVHTISCNLAISEKKKTEIQEDTINDPTLKKVKEYCETSWPQTKKNLPRDIMAYWVQRNSLYVQGGLIFNKDKVVIPNKMRLEMLDKLHQGHVGTTKMKIRARNIMYWPGITAEIEKITKNCKSCATYGKAKTKESLHSHTIPELPFEKIGVDVAEDEGKNYLVVVDYYSKWIDYKQIKGKTAKVIIETLKSFFAIYGIPKTLVSDNMPFSSYEFQDFAAEWEFDLSTSSPNYPQSNGMAEKAVGIVKQILKKCKYSNDDIQLALLAYRNNPVAGMKYSPAELLMSRQLRTTLPIQKKQLEPNVIINVREKLVKNQKKQKEQYDKTAQENVTFDAGQKIFVRSKNKWAEATVVRKHAAPRSYIVEYDGKELRKTSRHIKPRSC